MHDPHYWDALGCYVYQGRFMARHGLDLPSYRALPFIRPPLFTGLLALVMRWAGPSREALHVVTAALCGLVLPATFVLGRRFSASPASAVLGAALCLATPPFFAQAGLVQSDLPATLLCTVAWVLLLSGRTAAFVACASLAVLTKESAYFLCAPAALLLWLRARPRAGAPASRPVARWLLVLRAVWPAAVPCLVLAAWQVAHGLLHGRVFAAAYAGYIGPGNLPWALFHNFLDGGRFVLLPLAGLAVAGALRGLSPRDEVLCTALGVLLLPLLFPAPLPRYMLPSLPLLCALAGLGLDRLPSPGRALAAAAAFAVLLLGMHGRWTRDDVAHQEDSLAYRDLLALHVQAAQLIAAERPARVLCGFPMFVIFNAPPEDGYLPERVPIQVATPADDDAALCQSDLLVQAQDGSVTPAIERLRRRGALTLLRQLGPPPRDPAAAADPLAPLNGEIDRTIRIYRVRCR